MTTQFLHLLVTSTLLLLCLFPLAIKSAAPNTYIMDTDGEPIINGGTYYILPQSTSNVGGLKVVPSNTTSSCPLYITLENDPTSKGLPIKISSPINSKYLPYGPTIFTFTSDMVNTSCSESLVWQATPDDATGRLYVSAGMSLQPGPSAFNILTPFNYVQLWNYEIIYCDDISCGSVGIFEENGLLGMTHALGFSFRFKKAFTTTSVSTSVM